MVGRPTVQFVHGRLARREMVAFLEAHEPATTQALGNTLSIGLHVWKPRAWLVVDGPTVIGAVVETRHCYDRWDAFVTIRDPVAAPAAARIVDRGPALFVNGLVSELMPVLEQMGRLRFADRATISMQEHPVGPLDPPDDRPRLANIDDEDQFVELYCSYGIGVERTRWQLRKRVRQRLQHGVVVVTEVDGRIAGALVGTARTRRFLVGDELCVNPELRGQGLSKSLKQRVAAILNSCALGSVGVLFYTNPIPVMAGTEVDDSWAYGVVYDQSRFPGHARLRRIVHRIDPLPPTELVQHRPVERLPVGGEAPETTP